MGGGILDLVAKSIEDIFIIGKPEITLFKTVYRRHVAFSIEQKKLKFSNRVDFGYKTECQLLNLGDLLHKLYLVLVIPKIDIRYIAFKVSDAQNMLSSYNLFWTPSDSASETSLVTNTHLTEITSIINNKITELTTTKNQIGNITTNNTILNTIQTIYTGNVLDNDFFDAILDGIMEYDTNNIAYEFIKAYMVDNTGGNLTTLPILTNDLFTRYRDIVIIPTASSFRDDNLIFLNNIQRQSFNIHSKYIGYDSKVFFNDKIDQIYSDTSYQTLDSYKIASQYLTNNIDTIKYGYNTTEIKTKMLSHINYLLGKNIQLLIKIYHNISLAYQFTIYKKFTFESSINSFKTTENFINLSTSSVAQYDDKFTNNFTLEKIDGEPDYIVHFYNDYVTSLIAQFHIDMRGFFEHDTYQLYFKDHSIWSNLSITSVGGLNVFYYMNYIPARIIDDISIAINFAASDVLGVIGAAKPNVIGLSNIIGIYTNQLKIYLKEIITEADLLPDDNATTLTSLSQTHKETPDVMLLAFFIPYKFFSFGGISYDVMTYLKKIHTAAALNIVDDYNRQYAQGIINTSLSYATIIRTTSGANSVAQIITVSDIPSADNFSTSGTPNYFLLYSALDKTIYNIWFNVNGSFDSNIFNIVNTTGIKINVDSNDTGTTIASTTATTINNISDFSATSNNDDVTITNATVGYATLSTTTSMPQKMTFIIESTGSSTVAHSIKITMQSGSVYNTSTANYFALYSADNTTKYHIWLNPGAATHSATSGFSNIEVSINTNDTASEIATKIATAVNSNNDFSAVANGVNVTVTNAVVGIAGSQPLTNSNYDRFINAVDIFFLEQETDNTSLLFPEYSRYLANSKSLYLLNDSSITFKNPLDTNTVVNVLDAQSSIWYNIYTKMIAKYNSFYNDNVLQNSYTNTSLGNEIARYKAHIDTSTNPIILNNLYKDLGNGEYSINYFLATATDILKITHGVTGYLSNELTTFNTALDRYNKNNSILNLINQDLPNDTHYYETFNNTHKVFEDMIYDNYTGNESTPANLTVKTGFTHDPILINMNQIKTTLVTAGKKGIMDKFNDLISIKNIFYDHLNDGSGGATTTPNGLGTAVSAAYVTYISNLSSSARVTEKAKFDAIIASLTSTILYKDVGRIEVSFNKFALEDDFYKYLVDLIFRKSIVKDLLFLKQTTRKDTYDTLIAYYNSILTTTNTTLDVLQGNNQTQLIDLITQKQNKTGTPKFAWIEKLGHYIIKKASVSIGGEVIDNQTGEFLNIDYELSHHIGKERGYNRLIGNITDLTSYNNISKKETVLYIPLQFWFNKYASTALPMVSLLYTDVVANIEFSSFNDSAYWESDTYFKKKPKLSGYLLGEYMYVDPDERANLATTKHEYLIEKINYLDNRYFDINRIATDRTFEVRLRFENPCKELFWILQLSKYVDGTLNHNSEIKSINSKGVFIFTDTVITTNKKAPSYYGINDDGTVNPIENVKIIFNGVVREAIKDGFFYNYVVPHKHNHNIPADGIMTYSFALYPDTQQPSGSVNMSRIDEVTFKFTLKQETITLMTNNKYLLRVAFYDREFNILRIVSGMAGLAFY